MAINYCFYLLIEPIKSGLLDHIQPHEMNMCGFAQPAAVTGDHLSYLKTQAAQLASLTASVESVPARSLLEQFFQLAEGEGDTTLASSVRNRHRNRFDNILPYDHSCVRLKPNKYNNFNSYINASHIRSSLEAPCSYIAAQGPKDPETIVL